MRNRYVSARRRTPYPPRQIERGIEDRLEVRFLGHADTVSVTRQMRFSDGSRADLVVEAWLPDVLDTRIVTVVEVKAGRAGVGALAQLNRYLAQMRTIINEEMTSGIDHTILAGMLAAPRFSPEIEDYADRCSWDETPFSILRVAA